MENLSALRLLLAAVTLFIFVYIFLRGLRVCFWQFLTWWARDEDKQFLFWTVQRKR